MLPLENDIRRTPEVCDFVLEQTSVEWKYTADGIENDREWRERREEREEEYCSREYRYEA